MKAWTDYPFERLGDMSNTMTHILVPKEVLQQVLDKLLIIWEPCELTAQLTALLDAPCEPAQKKIPTHIRKNYNDWKTP